MKLGAVVSKLKLSSQDQDGLWERGKEEGRQREMREMAKSPSSLLLGGGGGGGGAV